MPTNNRNINPVGWVDDKRRLPHVRKSAYGEVLPQIVPLGYVPPFQLVRDSGAANISSIILFKLADSSETDITDLMESTGFAIKDFGSYKIWEYPATIALPGTFDEGRYSMIIRDSEDKFTYREIFSWKNESGMTDFVKLEWFHLQKVELAFGHIEFEAPFKFWHYFQTEMGKPDYPVNRNVEERDGYEFTLKVTSWREDKFVTIGNQLTTDALTLIQNMDCVFAYFLGEMFEVNRAIVTPKWIERGHVAGIEFELRSGTIVTTFGDATEQKDYTPMKGDCMGVDIMAKAQVTENSASWASFHYVVNGTPTAFEIGDYVLVFSVSDEKTRIYQYIGGAYSAEILPASKSTVYDMNADKYYFYTTAFKVQNPLITTLTSSPSFDVQGLTFKDSIVEVWGKNLAGEESLLATGTDTEFGTTGIPFEEADNISFQVRAKTFVCNNISQSPWIGIDGIGVMVIGSTFIVGSDLNTPQPNYPVGGN